MTTSATRRRERRLRERQGTQDPIDADLRAQIPPEEWETLTLIEKIWVSARYREMPSHPNAANLAMGLLRFIKETKK